MTIPLDNLHVSQDDLRLNSEHAYRAMIRNAKGVYWHDIKITRFEDSVLMIHDGHHRCVGAYLNNRHYLRDDEYCITDWTYRDYETINPTERWILPFDPKVAVRRGDFARFKNEAAQRFAMFSVTDAGRWIVENAAQYLVPRKHHTLREFAEAIKRRFQQGMGCCPEAMSV